jgi:DNA repair protein RadA/Sms
VAKVKTQFVCQSCGYRAPKWLGRCPDCDSWNSLVEEQVVETPEGKRRGWGVSLAQPPIPITEIEGEEGERMRTRIGEFDRVLGGGIVPGSIVLIGGDPGIGKSTLLLQVSDRLSREDQRVLYVSGEESPRQTKIRAERLGVHAPNLLVLSETSLEEIFRELQALKPSVLIVDSIQAIFTSELQSAPGSISQVRESSARLMQLAKGTGIPIFLIGHVTKEGAIAGPRVVEHMVDTVLYFEGGASHPYRILRAVKNRFGPTNEIGVFEMKESGLEEVLSPSEIFLSERPENVSGSVVVPSIEGTRPILVEIQALVSPSSLAVPRRTTIGVDHNRVALLVAVLEKRMGFKLYNQDIFLNVAGGIRVDEPAMDLGVSISVASSFLDKPIHPKTVLFGEVGLAGEVRGISQGEVRVKESIKLGFQRCILPKANRERMKGLERIDLVGAESLAEVIRLLL